MNNILQEDFEYILKDKNIDWEKFSGKTLLITGASGFLASYIVKSLLLLNKQKFQKPLKILGLIRNIENAQKKYADYIDDENLVLVKHNVIEPYVCNENIDYIIHSASQASPKYFFSDPVGTINANTIGTNNMLALAKEKNVKSFLYFSTGEVNGDVFGEMPVSENDYGAVNPLNVRNSYAESKRMGENMCVSWCHQYGVPAKIVRPSHTYGPDFDLNDGRAFASFVALVLQDKNIVLKSDGSARRSFCYLADAVRAYLKVLLDGQNANAYNVGNEYEISILDLAKTIIKASGKNLKVVLNADSSFNVSSKVVHGLLDIAKIKKLGWTPVIKEEEGFKRVILSFQGDKNE